MASITDILTAIQNAVSAIQTVNTTLSSVFPKTTASSTSATAGTITFTSSQAAGFLVVQTSSGATVKVPYYNS